MRVQGGFILCSRFVYVSVRVCVRKSCLKTGVLSLKKSVRVYRGESRNQLRELELDRIKIQMTLKPMLRVEVFPRALRVRLRGPKVGG